MPIITLYLPKMGESVMEAVVLNWLVQEKETIAEGSPLLEVATDKVNAEVPSLCAGVVKKILVRRGEVVAVGAPIALLEVEEEEAIFSPTLAADEKPSMVSLSSTMKTPSSSSTLAASLVVGTGRWTNISPIAKQIATAYNIQPAELEKLRGSTKNNRITKNLLLEYLHKRTAGFPDFNEYKPNSFSKKITLEPGDEVVPMDRVRKLIAYHMVESKKIAPHVTSFIRADVTQLVQWRNQNKSMFEQKHGIKLTYNPLFMMVIARALQTFPLLNSFLMGENIIKRKHINMGFAVALSNGNLMVPVVKQVECLSFSTLAKQIDSLILKARSGILTPDELADATYTVSNIGSFGNLMGTPIIMQPQVAILALGVIERRPAVAYREDKETLTIRDEMFLSHSYDHRIIDGSIGGGFLKYLALQLKNFPQNWLIEY